MYDRYRDDEEPVLLSSTLTSNTGRGDIRSRGKPAWRGNSGEPVDDRWGRVYPLPAVSHDLNLASA
jgi:hypothetical protein